MVELLRQLLSDFNEMNNLTVTMTPKIRANLKKEEKIYGLFNTLVKKRGKSSVFVLEDLENIEEFHSKIEKIKDSIDGEHVLLEEINNVQIYDCYKKTVNSFKAFLTSLSNNFDAWHHELVSKYKYNSESIRYLLTLGVEALTLLEDTSTINSYISEEELEIHPNYRILKNLFNCHSWMALEFSENYFLEELDKWDKNKVWSKHTRLFAEIVKNKVDIEHIAIFKELENNKGFAIVKKPTIYSKAKSEYYYFPSLKRIRNRVTHGSSIFRVHNYKIYDLLMYVIVVFCLAFHSFEFTYKTEVHD